MGRAYSTHMNCRKLWWGVPKEKDHLEDEDVGRKIWLGGGGGVEWIHLAQGRDRWRAVVNAVMNLWVLGPRIHLCSMRMEDRKCRQNFTGKS
jgi:hypothetical protein